MSSSSQSSGLQNSLWDIAIKEKESSKSNEKGMSDGEIVNTNVVFCGASDCGKTTVIHKFAEKDETIKPTIALEYTFTRKTHQNNTTTIRDVIHIWEMREASMIDIVLKADNIESTTIVLAVDLSKPNEMSNLMETLLNQIKQRINQVLSEVSKKDSSIEGRLKENAWKRCGTSNKCDDLLSPLLIPLVILGCKYDPFQVMTSDQRQMIGKMLRFLAFTYGAALQFHSTKTEGLATRVKSLLSNVLIGSPHSKSPCVDINKPLYVPFGSDSLEQIGAPPIPQEQLSRIKAGSPMELWKRAYKSVFPPQDSATTAAKNNPAADTKYEDDVIDKLREQKNQELDRYRKLSQRRDKEAKVNAHLGTKNKKKVRVLAG